MRRAHRVEVVRAAEAVLLERLPPGTLMQRAAAGLAAAAAGRLGRVYGARVVALVGSGDNGGDALYAGARLAARGARVDAVRVGARIHEAAAEALRRAGGRLHPATAGADVIAGADIVLDGILGIGGRGGLRDEGARVSALADPRRTIAVDVPSGVNADTGAVPGAAVRAGTTVTFGTLKPGLLVRPGADHAGRVVLVPIGLDLPEPDLTSLDDSDVAARLPTPGPRDTKYTRGVVGVVAGSEEYPGAGVLCAGGALRGGAGYVRFVATAHPVEQVRLRFPEVVTTTVSAGDAEAVLRAGRVQAWVAGPGLGTGDDAAAVVEALLGTDLPVLLDADALTVVSRHRAWLRRSPPTLLTPHEGEFARLVPDATPESLAADRLGAVRAAAADLGATVLLKGATTLVVDPDGRARVNSTGTGRLATAGSGDVLSGLAGALLAGGLDPLHAGSVAAHVHGLAARRAQPPVAAGDLLASLPQVWAALT